MATRLQAEFIFIDKTTKPLQSIIGHLDATQRAFDRLNKKGSVFSDVSTNATKARSSVRAMSDSMGTLNTKGEKTIGMFRQLRYSLLNIYIMAQAFKSVVRMVTNATETVDQFNRTTARLTMVDEQFNGANANMDKFYRQLMQGATDARITFDEFAQQVSKLGLQAGHAFTGTKEIMRFTELASKSFKIAGTSAESQRAAMYQLTQALASNRLQGDEFRSIIENMPQLVQMLNKKLGTTHAELREMASAGELSATVIKQAMFESADDINARFAQLPMTFGEQLTLVKNAWTDAMKPIYADLGRFANSPEFAHFISIISDMARDTAKLIAGVIKGLVNITLYLRENKWILDAITSVLISGVILMAIQKISNAMKILALLTLAVNWPLLLIVAIIGIIVFVARQMGFTWGEIWYGMQVVVAMLWEAIVNTLAGIAILFVIVVHGILTQSQILLAVLTGIVFAIGAVFRNVFVFIANIVLSVVEWIINKWIDFQNAIGDIVWWVQDTWARFQNDVSDGFRSFINGLITLVEGFGNAFVDMVNKVIGTFNRSGIMKLLNFASDKLGLGKFSIKEVGKISLDRLSLSEGGGTGVPKPEKKSHVSLDRFEYGNIGDAYNKGYGLVNTDDAFDLEGVIGAIEGFANQFKWTPKKPGEGGEYVDPLTYGKDGFLDSSLWSGGEDGGLGGLGGTGASGGSGGSPNVGSVGKIKEPVKLSDEAMKLFEQIRDGAFLRGYATISPNVYITYTSNNNGSADESFEKNAHALQRMILEELATNLKI